MRIGLALGGGGARGLFHIGVLKVLERLRLKPAVISGTSIGALIGALYSLKNDAQEVEKVILEKINQYAKDLANLKRYFSSAKFTDESVLLGKSFSIIKELYLWNLCLVKPHLVEPKPFFRIFKELFAEASFSDCQMPFIATTVDLISGRLVFLKEGSLLKAVIASTALPGFFPPLRLKDKILVDGGVLEVLPVQALFKRADFILGVSLEGKEYVFSPFRNAIDLLCLTDRIRYRKIVEENLKKTNLLIFPSLEKFSWGDFDRAEDLIRLGEEFTQEFCPALIQAIKREKIKRFFLPKNIFLRPVRDNSQE